MNTSARIFKAGNSLAIRLPSVIAKHYELEDGTEVEISSGLKGNEMVVTNPGARMSDGLDVQVSNPQGPASAAANQPMAKKE